MASACGCESESLREGAGEIIVEGPWGPEKQAGRGRREIGSDTITRSQESAMIVGAAQKAAMIPPTPTRVYKRHFSPCLPSPGPQTHTEQEIPPPPFNWEAGEGGERKRSRKPETGLLVLTHPLCWENRVPGRREPVLWPG